MKKLDTQVRLRLVIHRHIGIDIRSDVDPHIEPEQLMAKNAEVEHVRADLKKEEEEFKVYSLLSCHILPR